MNDEKMFKNKQEVLLQLRKDKTNIKKDAEELARKVTSASPITQKPRIYALTGLLESEFLGMGSVTTLGPI